MKFTHKTILFMVLVGISALFSSCEHELESFGENPNEPLQVPLKALLPTVEVATFANQSSGLVRYSTIFTQQLGGNQFQTADYGRYLITEQDTNNEWLSLYSETMNEAYILINQAGDKNPYYRGIGKTLMALNLSNATDIWNEVPYTDAFKGSEGNINPKYDTQESIYKSIQNLLSEAIADFSQPSSANVYLPENDDFIYKGNVSLWKKAAYALKARFALRLSQRVGSTVAAQEALNYINSGAISSNSENMNAVFGGESNDTNQWYAFNQERGGYLKMGKFFIDLLNTTNDPRISFYAKPVGSVYIGIAPEQNNVTNASNMGTFLSAPKQPIGMITFAEVKFIEAEAKFRMGDTTGAKTAFEQGVAASVLNVTGAANPTFVSSVTTTVDLKNIITQKYVALFGNIEPYNDYRRTGFPVLTPNTNGVISTIPVRLVTPQNERLYNSNAVVVGNLTTPVWWDN